MPKRRLKLLPGFAANCPRIKERDTRMNRNPPQAAFVRWAAAAAGAGPAAAAAVLFNACAHETLHKLALKQQKANQQRC
jgi:hypothetical protein